MEWAMESHSKDYWSFWASWLHGEGLGNGIPYQESGFSPFNPYFHPMTGLLELLVGLLAAWRGFGQWNGQWNPIVRTTGASGPLGCR